MFIILVNVFTLLQCDVILVKLTSRPASLIFLPSISLSVCLDGTLPGFHLHRGHGSGADSWLIQLEVSSAAIASDENNDPKLNS